MGAGAEPHYHDNDEFWLFTKAHGEVVLDGQVYEVTPNTLVNTPMGPVHHFQMFTEYEVVPAITRLERARRPGHLYPALQARRSARSPASSSPARRTSARCMTCVQQTSAQPSMRKTSRIS